MTSAMVTLYFEVELSRESLPGTEQNRSVGLTTHVPPADDNKHVKRLDGTKGVDASEKASLDTGKFLTEMIIC